MYIDIGIAGIVVIFIILGLLSGFWGQILRLAALISLFFIAPPVARAIQGPVADVLGTGASESMIWGTSLIVSAVLLYLGMSIIIAIILHASKAYKDMSGTNRMAGMFLGLLKGILLTYLLACGFAMVTEAGHLSGTVEEQASESYVVDLVAKFNLIERLGYDLDDIVATITTVDETGEAVEEDDKEDTPTEGEQPQTPPTGVPANQPYVPTSQVPSAPPAQVAPIVPPVVPSQGFPVVPSQPPTYPPGVAIPVQPYAYPPTAAPPNPYSGPSYAYPPTAAPPNPYSGP